MTSENRTLITRGLAILVAFQLVGLLYFFYYFVENAYLPSPFVYDKSDTFMDFFHVLYWSTDPGRYSVWGSVYPPLNFLIMKLFGFMFTGTNTFADGFEIRSYSLALRIFVAVLAISMVGLSMRSRLWNSYSTVQKFLFFLFFILSAPVLFAIERGNIIILCLPFLAGVMASSGVRRLVFIAILINLKPYFVLLALAPLFAGKWQDFLFIVMSAGAIFIFSGLVLDPNFLLFLPNILSFGQSASIFSGREVLALPSSIDAFAYALLAVLRNGENSLLMGIDLSYFSFVIRFLNKLALIFALIALLSARNRLPQTQLLAFTVVIICNLGVWVGGYSFIFLPLIIPALLNFRLKWVFLSLVIAIMLPLDIFVIWREMLPARVMFFTGLVQTSEFQITFGTLLRPIFDFALLVLMSIEIFLLRWFMPATGVKKNSEVV